MRRFVTGREFRDLERRGAIPAGGEVVIAKSCASAIRSVDRERRVIEFTLSTPAVDREGDTIAVDGWDISNYRKNPVVLFAHDHLQPPIARAEDVWIDGDRLKARDVFTPPDLNPFGDLVFRLYAERFMNAVSVGFLPEEWAYAEDRKSGVNFYHQELLEHSCVPVPANASALMTARGNGIDLAPMKAWAERMLDELARTPATATERARYERVRLVSDDVRRVAVCLGSCASRPPQTRAEKVEMALRAAAAIDPAPAPVMLTEADLTGAVADAIQRELEARAWPAAPADDVLVLDDELDLSDDAIVQAVLDAIDAELQAHLTHVTGRLSDRPAPRRR